MKIGFVVLLVGTLIFGLPLLRAQQQASFKPIADVKQLMQSIVIPSSTVVFRVEVEAPQSDQEWERVVNNALAMAEAGNLLMLPGRAKNDDDWMKKSVALIDVGVAAMKAAQVKDVDAVIKIGYQIYEVCKSCHDSYMPRVQRRQ